MFRDYNRKPIAENTVYIHVKTKEVVCFRYLDGKDNNSNSKDNNSNNKDNNFIMKYNSEGKSFLEFKVFNTSKEHTREYRQISLKEILDSDTKPESILNKVLRLKTRFFK